MIDVLNLLKNQPSIDLLEDEQYIQYQEVLQSFWNQDYNKCLDQIFSVIDSNLEPTNIFLWYRLWIEVLCEQKDFDSLRLLNAHLLNRSVNEEDNPAWQALRGLVHLELDEWEACELLAEFLGMDFSCAYSLEFIQRFHLRTNSEEDGYHLDLVQSEQDLVDYFHWQNLARVYLLCGSADELVVILKFVSQLFPESPLHDEFFAYLYLDDYRIAEAKIFTEKLKSRFSKNLDFSYLHGYVQRNLKDFKGAIKTFQNLRNQIPNDPDVMSELAYCHFIKSENDVFSFHWEKSITLHKQAKEAYQQMGFPTTDVIFKQIEQENTSHINSGQESIESSNVDHNFWVVNLSQRRSYEISEYSDDEIKVLFRPMSNKLKRSDLVFFMANDAIHEDTWRLTAIYKVAIDPIWHPYEESQLAMTLIRRFDFPILLGKMPLQMQDRRSRKRANDPTKFGVFQLDEQGFDTIRSSIREWGSLEIEQDLTQVYGKIS